MPSVSKIYYVVKGIGMKIDVVEPQKEGESKKTIKASCSLNDTNKSCSHEVDSKATKQRRRKMMPSANDLKMVARLSE